MRSPSRLLSHGVVLIAAMVFWLRPFCPLPELGAADHGSATLSEQAHSQHPMALCDDHLLHAAGIGHDAHISTKTLAPSRVPLAEPSHDQFSVGIRSDLDIASLPAPPSASHRSVELYTLHSVYLI